MTAIGYNDPMKILFLHGWPSVPGGITPSCMVQHEHEVINPKLPDEDFAESVRIALDKFDKHQSDVVIGSSQGGAVAMNFSSGDTPLVLLCPVWKRRGMEDGQAEHDNLAFDRPTIRSQLLTARTKSETAVSAGVGTDRGLQRSSAGRPGVNEGDAQGV
jgi:hypothetical protein